MHTAAPKITAQKHKKLEFQAAEINIEDKVYNQINSKTGLRIFFSNCKATRFKMNRFLTFGKIGNDRIKKNFHKMQVHDFFDPKSNLHTAVILKNKIKKTHTYKKKPSIILHTTFFLRRKFIWRCSTVKLPNLTSYQENTPAARWISR